MENKEMDYSAIGLRVGLECHQQLETGKLYCRCQSKLRDEKPDMVFSRKLRPVASELGEFDKAALEAFRKNLTYVYEAYNDSTCLIELDEEPPMPVDSKALETILKVSMLCNSNILNELFAMRKTVIDGSNTSGFQRTMLVALGGSIDIGTKKIGVQSIVLEEDAARPIQKTETEITYRLDRLGIPLIELATAPDMNLPEEVKKTALKIGEIFRRTCSAKRGLGTIRQDVNISIKGGARIEIKGVQNIELMDEYVKREIKRQMSLLELKNELQKRGISGGKLENNFKNLTELFSGTNSGMIKKAFERGEKIFGTKISGFRGLTGMELQPNRRFGTELSDYVKTKTGLKGLIHLDELPNYGITAEEIEKTKKELDCNEKDNFVFVMAKEEKAKTALEIVIERCKTAMQGIPNETRDALDDANTSYSRPLPGAARMYPETDVSPVKIEEKFLQNLKKGLPLETEERISLYQKHGLSSKQAEEMKLDNSACFFEELLKKQYNAVLAATMLLENLTQLKRENFNIENVSKEKIEEILKAEKGKKISKDNVLEILRKICENPEKSLDEIIQPVSSSKASSGEIEKIIASVVEKNSEMVKQKGMAAFSALMGDSMKELKGKAGGEQISAILKSEIQKRMDK